MKTKSIQLIAFLFYIGVNSQVNFTNHTIIEDYIFPSENISKVLSFDVDGDLDNDIIYSSFSSNEIGWLENLDGLGTYGSTKTTTIDIWDANIVSIIDSDIDQDGDIDIIYISLPKLYGNNIYSKIGWLENDGDGNFTEREIDRPRHNLDFTDNNPSPWMNAIHTNDMDGDGDIDIVAMSGIYHISWYENLDGLGSFNSSSHTISSNQFGVFNITSADMDGDGDIDIVSNITSQDNKYIKIGWFENLDGTGSYSSFKEIYHYSNSSGSFLLEIGDLDGDNNNDISLVIQSTARWLKNENNGSFSENSIPAYRCTSMKLYDIDKDNDLDIVFGHSLYDNGDYLSCLSWFENLDYYGTFNNNNGAHKISSNDFFSSNFVSNTVTDIDNDNDLDIISSDYRSVIGHSIIRYRNITNQTFEHEEGGPSVSPLSVCTAIDLDNDNDLDFVASAYRNTIVSYENLDGTGQNLGDQKIIAKSVLGEAYKLVSYGDIDGDNFVDIVAKFKYDLVVFKNKGNGEFEEPVLLIPYDGLLFTSIKVGDIDNDGDNDIVVYYFINTDNKGFFWHENTDGNGNFGLKNTIVKPQGTNTVVTGTDFEINDIDGDGDKDLVYSSTSGSKWIENINGNFETIRNVLNNTGSTLHFSISTDMDGDDDLDIVGAKHNEDYIYWYENLDGLGNFHWQGNSIYTGNLGDNMTVYSNDIDNDGDNDILISSSIGLTLFENLDSAGGNFEKKSIISLNIGMLSFADINGDGNLDFSNSKSWFNNRGLSYNKINGTIRLDIDNNGCDISDLTLENIPIYTSNGITSFKTFSFSNGFYELNVLEEGDFTTSVVSTPTYYSYNPTFASTSFTGFGNTSIANFCLEPNQTINDLNITILPTSEARPGFDANYQLVFHNVGTTQLDGNIVLDFDNSKLSFLSASETISSQTTNSLTFNYSSLDPFETRTINLEFNVLAPPTTNIGDVLTFTATINPILGDNTENDNIFELNQTVIGSYDPNDIQVLEGNQILIDDADEYLHYIIRFQNTGTASAINVRVENVLDSNLDWATIQLESSSHTNRVEIRDDNEVSFIFDGIYLPDSTTDEPNSHGFIAYKIKPKSDVIVGDIMPNQADIFFDFNPAITTNIVTTEITSSLSVDENLISKFYVYPNPTTGVLNIKSNSSIAKLEIYNNIGQVVSSEFNKNSIDVSTLSTGLYFVRIEDSIGNLEIKKIVKK